jgi:arylsulfatase A-like enzyme
VGRLLGRLKEIGTDSYTLVIFSSDNGPHKEGGIDPEFFQSSGPLRGIKRDLYEGGIRVPMIARWPGHVAAGSESDHVSAFWDILPTLAEVGGASLPDGLDGISMLPALLGKPQPRHEYLYWEFHEGSSKQAVRMGDWKAVRLAPSKPIELYDLASDIGEERDVASEHPSVVEKARQILATSRTDEHTWPLKDKATTIPH